MSRRLKAMFGLLVALLLSLIVAVILMADGIQQPRTFHPLPQSNRWDDNPADSDVLKVLTWNIAWAYGWGSEGTGTPKDKAHFEKAIQDIIAVIDKTGADVVLLQEVDLDSTRSHYVNQAREVSQGLRGMSYAEAESWRANWVPFPYWPPSHHFGKVSSGGAILTRDLLREHRVELLEKPDENPFWYNLFYLFRYIQSGHFNWKGRSIKVYNVHLDAFSQPNREAQAKTLALQVTADDAPLLIVGGDFNAVPPEASIKHGYPDEPRTSHETDRTVALLRAVDGLTDSLEKKPGAFTFPSDAADSDEPNTVPSHAPNRRLDYVFYGRGFELVESRVVVEAGNVSDHLPVLATLRLTATASSTPEGADEGSDSPDPAAP